MWRASIVMTPWRLLLLMMICLVTTPCEGNIDAERLYDDLMGSYNRLIRPVGNNTDKLTVHIGLKLSQLIDIDERNQIMTTNVWLKQVLEDWKFVALVLDKLMLWIFAIACVVGTFGIVMHAPSLYDERIPIDINLSSHF